MNDSPPLPPQSPNESGIPLLPATAIPYAAYDIQRSTDDSHLNLLSIFHFVCGGLLALFACFPIIHVILGIAMMSGKMNNPGNPQGQQGTEFVGIMFVVMGSLFILAGWGLAICVLLAGNAIRKRKWRMFILVIAGIECMFMPIGTVLRVFTIIVMLRPGVAMQFGIVTTAVTRSDQ